MLMGRVKGWLGDTGFPVPGGPFDSMRGPVTCRCGRGWTRSDSRRMELQTHDSIVRSVVSVVSIHDEYPIHSWEECLIAGSGSRVLCAQIDPMDS